MYLALNLSLGAGGISTPSPGLSYGSLSLDENSADGTAIATFTATNASNPGAFSLSSVVPSGTLKFTGSELQASSTAVDYEAAQTITATVSYTDDAGTHNFGITVDVQDVNEAPVGASQTLEFDVAAASDVTAPTLTTATDTANGATASTGSVSTNEANGTLYWVVTTSATAPTAAQVKLGQDNSSAAATDSGSQAVSATGAQATAATGLTASTAYTTHFMHEDAAANQSAVATASGFTTTVAAPTNTVAPVASGTATVGSTLSVTNGTWTGSPSYTYQWQADTVDISGATSSTFDTTGRAADEVIRCVVTGTNAGGAAAANSNGITLTAAGVTQPTAVNFTPSVYFNAIGPASTGTGYIYAFKYLQPAAQSGVQHRILFGDNAGAYIGPNGSRRFRNYSKDASNVTIATSTVPSGDAVTVDTWVTVVGYTYAHSGTWYTGIYIDGSLTSTTSAVTASETNLYQMRRINNDEGGAGSEAGTFQIQGLWLASGITHASATAPVAATDFFDGSGDWVVNTGDTVNGFASGLGTLNVAADWNALPGKTGTVT